MHDDFYQMYLEEMRDITPCTKEENARLLKETASGNKEAGKRLIEGNLQAALECAKEYDGKGVLLTDLVQEANMALTLAVGELAAGVGGVAETGGVAAETGGESFEEFMAARIKEALEAVVEEEVSAGKTGEELAARVNVLQTVSQALAAELGREATVEELADKMKMTVEEVKNIMKMAMDAMSMNAENMNLEDLAGVEGIEITEGLEDEEE